MDAMDDDFWPSRFHSSRHLTAVQAARLNSENQFSLDDSEGDDDVRACFPCPFCYVDIEVPVLCAHLQEEHCFDLINAVCPECAANLGKDMIGHFTMQHAHLLRRRRKSQRSGLWSHSSATPGKELRELSSFLGLTNANGRESTTDSTHDPLLSPFLCNIVAHPNTKGDQDTGSSKDVSMKSMELPISGEARGQDFEEKSQRAEFFQQVILSTIF